MALKEKIRRFYREHRLYALAAGGAVILALILLVAAFTAKQTILRGVLIGEGALTEYQGLSDGFVESLGFSKSSAKVQIVDMVAYIADPETPGRNFSAIEILVEYDAKGIADFLLGEGEAMKNLAYSEFFADLRDLLTQEQLDALEDKLLYVDMAVIRQLEQMALTQEYPEDFAFPDPKNPQDMEEPVPVLVDVTGHETLMPLFGDDAVLLAVAQNGGHRAAVKAFAEYLATEKE